MEDAVFVAKGGALEELIHEAADGVGIQSAAVAVLVHVFLEILLAILEDEDEFCFCVDDIVKSDDVDVLELLHEGDLADGGRGRALLRVEVNLFQRHDFIVGARTTLQSVSIALSHCLVFAYLVHRGIRPLAELLELKKR